MQKKKKEGDLMKRCSMCGCVIEDNSDDVCEVCKDDIGETTPSNAYIDTDMAYDNFVMKRFMEVK